MSINSSYMLFDFGLLNAKKGLLTFKCIKLVPKIKNDLIMNVIKVHLELFKASKIVKLYENSLEIRKQQFLAVKNRFDLGEATRSDLLRSKASISGAEAQLKVGEANVKKLSEGYKTLVGKSPETPTLPKMITEEPFLLENSIKVALKNDLGLKVLI